MTGEAAEAVAVLVSLQRDLTDGSGDAVGPYYEQLPGVERLVAEHPGEVAAALAAQPDRDQSAVVSVVDDLMRSASEGSVEALLTAVHDHDAALAGRCLHRQRDWHLRVHDGITADLSAEQLLRAVYEEDRDALEWGQGLVAGIWAMPARRAWDVLAAIGTSRLARISPEHRGRRVWQHLWAWVLALGPRDLYQANHPGPAVDAKRAVAHVDGFEAAVARRAADRPDDVTAWLLELGADLPGCGVVSCCRPSAFEAELLRRGRNLRVGAGSGSADS